MGMVSLLIGIIALVLSICLVIGSSRARGQAGFGYGISGMFTMLLAICGFVIGVRCYKQEDIYYMFPNLGVGLNGALALGYITLYFVGIL